MNPLPMHQSVAFQKANLIREALDTLRAGNALDERDDLDAANFLEWYDRTIPDVHDIKMLAGAMEIELAKRRGERIEDEGERRGRPENLSPGDRLSNAVMVQRKKDRVLAEQPEAVGAYVQREVTAQRPPTVKGAVRAATAARTASRPSRKAAQFTRSQTLTQKTNEELLAMLGTVADGERRTDAQLAKIVGGIKAFLNRVRLLPWLEIDRTVEGTTFQINRPLRAICESAAPCPALSYQSFAEYFHTLRAELTRRRKENHDEFLKRRWNSELIIKREQTALLDWIEQQLDRVPL
jgi:hypothetical protein